MKNDKLRMNVDYAINIVVAAFCILTGLLVIGSGIYTCFFLGKGFELLDFDNEYSRAFSFIILPFLIVIYIMLFGGIIVAGFIPTSIGVIIGALSSIARFSYTEHGTVVTKPYKTLMTTSYITSGATAALYLVGFILIIGMGLLSLLSP